MKVAEELIEALKGYEMNVPDTVDIAKDGILDAPESREKLTNLVIKSLIALGVGYPEIQAILGGGNHAVNRY